mmetsp:Transcript_62151/g.122829  ORF Transcript_62151/g.122829 Transcript_62151/m.122829 type:complete len:93 (-) Transcript_62151:227-505(-)
MKACFNKPQTFTQWLPFIVFASNAMLRPLPPTTEFEEMDDSRSLLEHHPTPELLVCQFKTERSSKMAHTHTDLSLCHMPCAQHWFRSRLRNM